MNSNFEIFHFKEKIKSLPLDNKNYACIHEVIDKIHNVGVDSIKVSPSVISNSGTDNNRCVPDEKNKMLLDYLNLNKKHIDFL